MTVIIGGLIGFFYLYLINKLLDFSMSFFEAKGIHDHCLKVLPVSIFIFVSSLIMGFALPEPILEFTGVFTIFTNVSGIGILILLILLLFLRPLNRPLYVKLFKEDD